MLRAASLFRAVCIALSLLWSGSAAAQAPALQTFDPPGGKGRGVLVVSGQSGPKNYATVAKQIADLGFNVVLVDGNDVFKKDNAGLPAFNAAVAALEASPKTAPGKIAAVGFSLGGGAVLTYATRSPDRFATVVAYYPFTAFIQNPDAFAAQIKVPTLILAATKDTYKDCCKIDMARKLAEAGKKASPALVELVEYPQADHAFILPGPQLRAGDTADALKRAAAHLKAGLK
jgi:dienelactone hydrolase